MYIILYVVLQIVMHIVEQFVLYIKMYIVLYIVMYIVLYIVLDRDLNLEEKAPGLNQWITRLFIEQPWLLMVSNKYKGASWKKINFLSSVL